MTDLIDLTGSLNSSALTASTVPSIPALAPLIDRLRRQTPSIRVRQRLVWGQQVRYLLAQADLAPRSVWILIDDLPPTRTEPVEGEPTLMYQQGQSPSDLPARIAMVSDDLSQLTLADGHYLLSRKLQQLETSQIPVISMTQLLPMQPELEAYLIDLDLQIQQHDQLRWVNQAERLSQLAKDIQAQAQGIERLLANGLPFECRVRLLRALSEVQTLERVQTNLGMSLDPVIQCL